MLTLERKWDRRVEQWHSHVTSAAAFEQVLRRLIQLSSPKPTDACVDLGAGTGFVTTALAPLVSSVLAVDISTAMAASLDERAARDGLRNVSTQVSDLREFDLPPGQRRSGRLQLRAASPARPGQAGPGGPGRPVAAAGRQAGHRRHDVRPRRQPARPRHPAAEGDRPGRQGTRRLVADREEPDPLRPARRAGASGHAGVLAIGAA